MILIPAIVQTLTILLISKNKRLTDTYQKSNIRMWFSLLDGSRSQNQFALEGEDVGNINQTAIVAFLELRT